MIKRITGFAFILIAGAVIGYGAGVITSRSANNSAGDEAAGGDRKVAYWQAPMDPNFRSDKPGKSPMGMDLIPVYEGEESNSGAGASSVRIDPSVVNNIGVRTAIVEQGSVRRPIHTVGRIVFDEEKVANIHLRSSGWIERLTVRSEGEAVEKGDLLFEVYSPDLVNAQAEFLQTLRSGNATTINASKDRLRALYISDDQIRDLEKTRRITQYIRVYAPISGVVTALNVADGQFFKPDTEIMALADLSTVWLMSDVFEADADQLRLGAVVEAQSKFEPGTRLPGTVDYIYPDLDAVTRTIPVRSVFDNAERKLKPGMFMTVEIDGPERPTAAIIPRQALIRTGRQERVILALGEGRFQPAAVTSGIESDGKIEILSGLNPGERVVVSGQFLIDSESSFAGATLRMQPAEHDRREDIDAMDSNEDHIHTPAPMETGANENPKGSDHSDHGAGPTKETPLVRAFGVIKTVKSPEKTLTIEHDAIPEIGWPAMTMDFSVSHTVDLASLPTGKRVSFAMSAGEDRTFVIQSVEAVQ